MTRPSQINQGTVLAVGPGRRSTSGDLIPVSVKEGDKVLLPEYGGTTVNLDETECVGDLGSGMLANCGMDVVFGVWQLT